MTNQEAIYFILDEMHKFIGLTPPPKEKREEYYSTPEWYRKAKWTEKQQEMFEKMMINRIYKDTRLRKALELPKNMQRISKAISMLMLNYGWEFKKKEENNEQN